MKSKNRLPQPFRAGDPARNEFRDKLTRFKAKFGAELGSKWAAEGLEYVQALEKFTDHLTEQVAAAKASNTELQRKLDAAARMN